MKLNLVLFLCFCTLSSFSQNLVINGDFELYDQCPQLIGSVNGYLQSAYNPRVESTTDYYNSCDIQPYPCVDFGHVGVPVNSMGIQEAQNGNAYIGLYLFDAAIEYREYIVIPLQNTLEKDSIYTISFYVSKPESFGVTSDAIMVAFSESAIPMDNMNIGVMDIDGFKMADSPIHNDEEWVFLSKTYQSRGNENYMIIGNFLSDSETIVEESNFEPWDCYPNADIGCEECVYLYIDNVSVEKANELRLFPNVFTPNGDGINDDFSCLSIGFKIIEGRVFNRWGNQVYEYTESISSWDGKNADKECEEGVYYYSFSLEDSETKEILIKQGCVSLYK